MFLCQKTRQKVKEILVCIITDHTIKIDCNEQCKTNRKSKTVSLLKKQQQQIHEL